MDTEKFEVFYPGVYSAQDQQLLDTLHREIETNTHMDDGEGELFYADLTMMKLYARVWDPQNPLFNDEDYGKGTVYASIQPVPCFIEPGVAFPRLPQGLGDEFYKANDGGDIVFLRPIYPGDTLQMYVSDREIFDTTYSGGSIYRRFRMTGTGTLVNQRGEVVMRGTSYGRNAFMRYKDPADVPAGNGASKINMDWVQKLKPIHTYTDADWDYIRSLWAAEEIRGSEKRYWEDVQVGDEPVPTCSGPYTTMDMVRKFGVMIAEMPSLRDMMRDPRQLEYLYRDQYGMYYEPPAMHYCSQNYPGARPVFYNFTARNEIIRMVTNYIGDDGWITKLGWRFCQLAEEMVDIGSGAEYFNKVPYMKGKYVNHHGATGDCLICRGYVTEKYKTAEGALIDLVCWAETLEGDIAQLVYFTVKLPTRQ